MCNPNHVHGKRCFWALDQARWVCRPVRQPEIVTFPATEIVLPEAEDTALTASR